MICVRFVCVVRMCVCGRVWVIAGVSGWCGCGISMWYMCVGGVCVQVCVFGVVYMCKHMVCVEQVLSVCVACVCVRVQCVHV